MTADCHLGHITGRRIKSASDDDGILCAYHQSHTKTVDRASSSSLEKVLVGGKRIIEETLRLLGTVSLIHHDTQSQEQDGQDGGNSPTSPDAAAASHFLTCLGATRLTRCDSYVDVSSLPYPRIRVAPRGGYTNFFPERLHIMLENPEEHGMNGSLTWCPHGRAFHIHSFNDSAESLSQSRGFRLSSCSRNLGLYGFLRVASGPDKGAYYHPLFLRGTFYDLLVRLLT